MLYIGTLSVFVVSLLNVLSKSVFCLLVEYFSKLTDVRVKDRNVNFGSVDVEKVSDGVPKELIRWTGRKLRTEAKLVSRQF